MQRAGSHCVPVSIWKLTILELLEGLTAYKSLLHHSFVNLMITHHEKLTQHVINDKLVGYISIVTADLIPALSVQ